MKIRNQVARNLRAGFSLAELMVVIVIIGLLATLVVPNVIKNLFVANTGKAKADIMSIDEAVKSYAVQNQMKYPESLQELVTPDQSGFAFLEGESTPKDPWGNEYIYEPPSAGSPQFKIICYGADGVPGGEGPDMDFTNVMIRAGEI
ncbi:MAG: type II secretion system major pseudopilin GspG [Planctomycetota bacterium]